MSQPRKKQEEFEPRYLPLPQPESRIIEPGLREVIKAPTLGQREKRVALKCGAMAS